MAKQLCDATNLSYESVRKKFKSATGTSISGYILNQRIEHSKQMLISGISIKEISGQLGYFDEYAFSNQFKKETGISPKSFKKIYG